MRTYDVELSHAVHNSYFCKRAADSLDIDIHKKSKHKLTITADLEEPYNIGLILGASGSGKTTLCKKIFGEDCFKVVLDNSLPIIEQFPENYDYEKRSSILCGVGLTQVPCWLRPVSTLSNGQRTRAECALLMCQNELTIIDEWTSVVDRTAAKIMSHCIQKHARKHEKRIVLVSCHYDVIEWLNPDWVIDCNTQMYEDRRLLRRNFERTEKLHFTIQPCTKTNWKYFSKYHYLTESLAPSFYFFGLFSGVNQIGFIAYSNYVPHSKKQKTTNKKMILHANRIVIHPDYSGLGLGILLATETANLLHKKYEIRCKFSSQPMYNAMKKNKAWQLNEWTRNLNKPGPDINRKTGFRQRIKTYTFKFVQNE